MRDAFSVVTHAIHPCSHSSPSPLNVALVTDVCDVPENPFLLQRLEPSASLASPFQTSLHTL